MGDEAASGDLPFRAEYAKSARAGCKVCKTKIDKGELRLAVMVQSPHFDGKVPHWNHVKCFFTRHRPKAVGDIAHFDQLRWEDQEKIESYVNDALKGKGPAAGGKGGKKGGQQVSKTGTIISDFRVELAKSAQSECKICEQKIKKGLPRIGKKEYESERARMYGPYDRWHHVECFAEKREEMGFFDSGDKLSGFMTLGSDDKELISSKLKEIKGKRKNDQKNGDEPDSKKSKVDEMNDERAKEKEQIKKQMKKIYYYRDMMERNMNKKELEELLTYNQQEIPTGESNMLDRLSDCMLFGALEPCTTCGGQFVFRSGVGYQCMGNVSEWTKCQEKTNKPERKEFKLPKEFREKYDFCKLYKFKSGQHRVIPHNPSTVMSSSKHNGSTSSSGSQSSSKTSSHPLRGLTFVLEGKVDKTGLKEKIEALGGKVAKSVNQTTAAVISNEDALKKNTKSVKTAQAYGIQIVTENVLDDVKTEGIMARIKATTISDWGNEPRERLAPILEKSGDTAKSTSGSMFSKDMPKSMKLKLKGGAYVDPESGLEHKAHVYKKNDDIYSVVLGAVNIQEGRNSYYKLQMLEHDVKKKYYIFRSWGRVGTTIGGTKLETCADKEEAMSLFKQLYGEKTGNDWKNRKNFKKVAGKFFPMELDLGEDNKDLKAIDVKHSNSKLPKAVQNLVALIFDIDNMKKAMVEFEIDLTKMPLGKLSRKQIETAYKILTEVQGMIKNDNGSDTKFLDASNRFFTLIPHDFGMKSPPVLNNADIVKSKLDMLDNLLEIEIAFNLLQTSAEDEGRDPIDVHYEKLKTDIQVLEKESDEFKILEKYVQNTHGATHTMYTLEIEEIFKIARKGEDKRFAKYKDLHNRMLLWHGSRTTNYAGILSQGLRIAPPEAPVTGYMFGKGIYFADMVSKSANYCCTSKSNDTGLLLLCDVALGDMLERHRADYIEKLPKGKHSVKGVGRTEPDPSQTADLNGVKVPLGKGVSAKDVERTDLLYNEYIVYDVAQCNVKYLFRMKFNYKDFF